MTARILIIEDDLGIRRMLERGLALNGYQVTVAEDLATARRTWNADSYEVVLLDVMLPDGDGIDLLSEVRAAGDRTHIILLTAREEAELRVRVARAGAGGRTEIVPKPFAWAELLAKLGAEINER